jgi:hypothetical protein
VGQRFSFLGLSFLPVRAQNWLAIVLEVWPHLCAHDANLADINQLLHHWQSALTSRLLAQLFTRGHLHFHQLLVFDGPEQTRGCLCRRVRLEQCWLVRAWMPRLYSSGHNRHVGVRVHPREEDGTQFQRQLVKKHNRKDYQRRNMHYEI